MTTTTLPSFFIPHGAGPCFFMDWEPADTWLGMGQWLRELKRQAGARPRALVVISAHWESASFSLNTAPKPGLLFDYYGFPPHTYQLTWPAQGAPELARRVMGLLAAEGIDYEEERERGLDHGVFVPLKLAFPEADIPVLQISLRRDLDPAAHLALGRALAPLRDEGALIIGSGMSYHNLQRYRDSGGRPDPDSLRFDDWLTETLALTGAEREERLRHWSDAPGARGAHPREEHLIPLHVAAGAAFSEPGTRTYHERIMGNAVSGYRFGG